jgi:hypothetical protein
MDGACSTHEILRNACKFLVRTPEEEKPLGKLRYIYV